MKTALIIIAVVLALATGRVNGQMSPTDKRLICKGGAICELARDDCTSSIIHGGRDSSTADYGTLEQLYGQVNDGCNAGPCIRFYPRDVCTDEQRLTTYNNQQVTMMSISPWSSATLPLPRGVSYSCVHYVSVTGGTEDGFTIELNRFAGSHFLGDVSVDFEGASPGPVQMKDLFARIATKDQPTDRIAVLFYNNGETQLDMAIHTLCVSARADGPMHEVTI